MKQKILNKDTITATIGVAAFVIGGIIARTKALDAVVVLEKSFNKAPKLPTE